MLYSQEYKKEDFAMRFHSLFDLKTPKTVEIPILVLAKHCL